jgi:hypothetical protein
VLTKLGVVRSFGRPFALVLTQETHMSERHIWSPIAEAPASIGCPGARPLHELQLGSGSGFADLVLIMPPGSDGQRVAIVEAKRIENTDAAANVVGQLLKYYAHALQLGVEGVEALWRAAERHDCKKQHGRLSAAQALGASGKDEAYARLKAGRPLTASEVTLHIALDGVDAKAEKRLDLIVDTLKKEHGLAIKVGCRSHFSAPPSTSILT